jgi:uncharacterized protein
LVFGSLSVAAVAWIGVSFAVASLAQSLSGFGFTLISVPLLSLVVSPKDAVVGQTFAGLVLSFAMAWALRADAHRDVLRRIVPASLVGMPIGILVSGRISDRGLRIIVGVGVITAATFIASGFKVKRVRPSAEYTGGFISGLLATTTGSNGPPLVVTLAARELTPAATRATLQVAFAVGNLVSVPLFIADGRVTRPGVVIAAIGLGPVVLGRLIGEPLFRRLDPAKFRVVVLVMLFAAGAVALIKAFA